MNIITQDYHAPSNAERAAAYRFALRRAGLMRDPDFQLRQRHGLNIQSSISRPPSSWRTDAAPASLLLGGEDARLFPSKERP